MIAALLIAAGFAAAPVDTPPTRKPRVAPPQVAFQLGLMPLASTGMSAWRLSHASADGRGVLIAILDGGVDPAIQGLLTTSSGEPKILDVRDFSGETDVPLTPLDALDSNGCAALRDGLVLCGVRAIVASADAGSRPYGGVLRELPLGNPPFADLNHNGTNRDRFGIVVVRRQGQLFAYVDTNGDGSLADEQPVADYLVRRETFSFSAPSGPHAPGLVTAVANLSEENGQPRLAIVLGGDHGTHVAGIAAGHMIYGVVGFDGVAPGAQLLSLKISNNARGGVSTTGSMLRAMQYADRFARERHLPLVMNMSFGVGNANEGRAVMDSIIDDFLLSHPDDFFAIAAGNDGPGTSTFGEPGSSNIAFAVGASYPASFAQLQFGVTSDFMGWWSSRGGELAKPDIVAPGVAYSTVPEWDAGGEVKGGTSMATPYVSGLAAVLISAMLQEQRATSPAALAQALRAGARPFAGESFIDQGPGLAQIEPAYQYLRAAHEAPRYRVEAVPTASQRPDVTPSQRARLTPGAYRRSGLAGRADTVQRFRISLVPDPPLPRRARTYRLTSDAAWLRPAAATMTIDSTTGSGVIDVRYDAAALARPGRYAGAVRGMQVGDDAAAPAFVLANTIVVPDSGVAARGVQSVAAAASRYYVRVPAGAGGLSVTLVVADTTMLATLSLYEPTGRPARGERSADIGADSASKRTAALRVTAEDLVPGVYEIVVQAMPGRSLTYDLTAHAAPPAVTVDSAGAAATIRFGVAPTAGASLSLIGAATTWAAAIDSTALWRRDVVVPTWARRMIVEVEVAPEVWDQVTDFGITVYDSLGAQLGNGAMNYPYHRISVDLPADRAAGYRTTVELSPGFARPAAPSRTDARVRVRFEAEERSVWSQSGAAPAAVVRVPAFAPFEAPDGFEPLLRLGVCPCPRDGAPAMTQLITLPPSRP
jgi:subtilisin family serine protease